jgi:hypothetical protein
LVLQRAYDSGLPGFLLTVLLYALALVPLLMLSSSKGPQWLTALGAGLVGVVFGTALLARLDVHLNRAVTYGLLIGLVMVEVAWAISFWSVVSLVGGALLWLVFYVMTGVSQAYLEGVLDRRVAIEYAVVSILGLAIILASTPWAR